VNASGLGSLALRRTAPALLALVLLSNANAAETIYISRSPSGKPIYSNQPRGSSSQAFMRLPAAAGTSVVAAPTKAGTARGQLGPQPAVRALVSQASAQHKLDVHLLLALIQQESGFNPDAVSPKGARGLMQLMPDTAARYGVNRIQDPAQNIAGGSAYLRDLLDMFGTLDLALAAYNAGEGAVLRYGRQIPPFAETQHYVRAVLAGYQERSASAQQRSVVPTRANEH
jgi:soluble lytic murein transglycosylase-like protein